MKPRILVVEDEAPILMGLCDVFVFNGLDPLGVTEGRSGLREALGSPWDLIVLDVMLPEVDGFTICRSVREERPRQPILLLTARGSEQDVLEGFAAGADDYVTKPFSVAQLMARVKALLRRSAPVRGTVLRIGSVQVDTGTLVASCGDRQVELSHRDMEILTRMAAEPLRVFGREELLREIWGYRCVQSVETRCVDMHMTKLRRKLSLVTEEPLVETVRGAGYRVTP